MENKEKIKGIRETITEKSDRLRDMDKMTAHQVAEELVELCSLLSSLNAQIVETQFIVNKKKAALLEEAKSVAKANVLVQASDEWRNWYERIMQAQALQELVRSCKYYIRAAQDEYKEFTR